MTLGPVDDIVYLGDYFVRAFSGMQGLKVLPSGSVWGCTTRQSLLPRIHSNRLVCHSTPSSCYCWSCRTVPCHYCYASRTGLWVRGPQRAMQVPCCCLQLSTSLLAYSEYFYHWVLSRVLLTPRRPPGDQLLSSPSTSFNLFQGRTILAVL
jgi:hypothetical protein